MKYKCRYCNNEKFGKGSKYCSIRCQIDYQNQIKIDNWKRTGSFVRVGTPVWLKKYILDKQDGKCAECGIKDWNGKEIVFDLEHKDGNSQNNKEENLCCLCPNCHSQTPTYKAKNKGNGRIYRRKYYGNTQN